MAKQYSLNKNEKLKSRKQLNELFAGGKPFLVFPVKIFFHLNDAVEKPAVKMGAGASKKYFRLAVHRNRVKRLLRETYRLNKLPLLNFAMKEKKDISIFFLYVDREIVEYTVLNDKMKKIIEKFIKLNTFSEEAGV